MTVTPYCNAPINRRQSTNKFCRRPAGEGTDHPGEGHCYLHGGGKATENVRKHAPVLEAAARQLANDDLESLFDMSNRGLVLARALAVQRLVTPGISSKESSDLTIAIQRIDKVLKEYEVEDDPDQPAHVPDALDEEAKRLLELKEKLA